MEIINCSKEDIEVIFELYDKATAYQKVKYPSRRWLGFERNKIEVEISERRQWKIIENGKIVCVFVIEFNDPLIWKKMDSDPAIYIHRIATDPFFRGNQYVRHIVAWATDYAKETARKYIRLDTGSGNEKLNRYYMNCGFEYVGDVWPDNVERLPEHYKKGSFSLFEIAVEGKDGG